MNNVKYTTLKFSDSVPTRRKEKLFFEEFSKRQRINYEQMIMSGYTQEQIYTDMAACHATVRAAFVWYYRPVIHYFLTPGLAAFLVDCVKQLEPGQCKPLPKLDAIPGPSCDIGRMMFTGALSIKQCQQECPVEGVFIIHFPKDEAKESIMITPNARCIAPDGEVSTMWAMTYCSSSIGAIDPSFIKELDTTYTNFVCKVVVGLALYMDAFPDTIKPAEPTMVNDIKHYTGTRTIVGTNHIVEEDRCNIKSPHWRRGHFRLLSSDKFIWKHGQTVWVSGCFVKGHAFDILDDAPPLKQEVVNN